MQVIKEADQKFPVKAWVDGVPLEPEARSQLINVAKLPFIFKHVAVMPDVHWGMGATVGSVIPTQGAIIPAAVGVDIGCGMIALQLGLTASDLPENLAEIRSAIEAAVPHGRTDHGGRNDKGRHQLGLPLSVQEHMQQLTDGLAKVVAKTPKLEETAKQCWGQLGTLGGGNHFIELCLDEQQNVWIMLHSGSRGIGNQIGQTFITKAKADMRRWFISVPDIDLAYFAEGSENFDDYIEAMTWAQDFAWRNRECMMDAVIIALRHIIWKPFGGGAMAVNCHHNYTNRENHFGKNVWVTRKGAVRAREGDLGIIPGSMGAKSFIVRGKGNKESFCSCSHGAGRKMSRTEAKKRFTLEDHAVATYGVECRKDQDVIDETPMAYKDIDAVMAAQSDLVEVVRTLKQIVCVKG